jgi:hypothetical protein
LPIAGVGPDKQPAYTTAARRLIELGHRRIVLLHQQLQQAPELSAPDQAFLNELTAHGIATSPYNLPHWTDSKTEFYDCLTKLFSVTPPTALIIDDASFFFGAFQFLADRGLRVPKDVSLICADSSPFFANSCPPVTHIHWDTGPVVRRVIQWVNNIAHRRTDTRQTLTPAKFIPGGTIGPALYLKPCVVFSSQTKYMLNFYSLGGVSARIRSRPLYRRQPGVVEQRHPFDIFGKGVEHRSETTEREEQETPRGGAPYGCKMFQGLIIFSHITYLFFR